MELRHLSYFIAVAEELHFGRAAKRLHMSQPPLSKQVRELENELGARLFDRSTQRVSLTQAGKVFLPLARKVVEDAAAAKLAATRAAHGEIGAIAIGFVSSSLYSILPTVVARFSQQFPDIEMRLQRIGSRAMLEALREHRIDVGFARAPFDDADLVVEGKLLEELVVALPEGHRLARFDEIELAALKTEQIVLMPHVLEQSVYFEIFDACAGAGFRPRFTPNLRQDAPDLQSALPLVAAGLGITLVPDSWQAVSLRGLVYRRLAPPAPAIELVILRGAGQPSPVLSTFLNVTNQQLARLRRPH